MCFPPVGVNALLHSERDTTFLAVRTEWRDAKKIRENKGGGSHRRIVSGLVATSSYSLSYHYRVSSKRQCGGGRHLVSLPMVVT